ncbi:hypothetical protein DPMN_097568 [Dreissena polymorpha]|uniref:MIR domain-containing protein n=1 Tax=Dreissena polymorpha TaxID=45954 RepID=A0A9D4LAR3_DREPO|nr:hypothetical protein DPMN_097568 [Dreissena polymorpha]
MFVTVFCKLKIHKCIVKTYILLFPFSQDDKKLAEGHEDEGMGKCDLKYGDSVVFIQHCATGLWLSYQTFETKKRGVGRVEEKKVSVLLICVWFRTLFN